VFLFLTPPKPQRPEVLGRPRGWFACRQVHTLGVAKRVQVSRAAAASVRRRSVILAGPDSEAARGTVRGEAVHLG